MQTKNQSSSGLGAEIRIIPIWAWILAGLAFIAAQIFFNFAIPSTDDDRPAPVLLVFMGLAGGFVLGTYLLFLGYINRDAKRRGMNPLLWTLVAIFIPNGLGIILYFILRQPRAGGGWPGTPAAPVAGVHVCPRCSCAINNCPTCGISLASSTATTPVTNS